MCRSDLSDSVDLTRTWAEFDERSARIAGALDAAGLGPDSKTALYMYNCNEYMEAQYGTFKTRGVSVNVNYRYLDDELWYLLDNSDSEALFFHSSLGDRVARVVDRLPNLKLIVEIDDEEGAGRVSGAQPYDDVLRGHKPALRIERSPDDVYMLYTGGTTGMPKGVMYAIGDFSGNPDADNDESISPGELARAASKEGTRKISSTCAPLMHGTGMLIGCFEAHLVGGQVITLTERSLDPHEVLDTIERHRVTMLTIVGDSFAKPLIRALDEGRPDGSRSHSGGTNRISMRARSSLHPWECPRRPRQRRPACAGRITDTRHTSGCHPARAPRSRPLPRHSVADPPSNLAAS